MRWYNHKNYGKFKNELIGISDVEIDLNDHTTIIKKFINLPESIARTFSLTERSCGRVNIEDLIQEGMVALCVASKMVDKDMVENSTDEERIIAKYLSIRIRGAIRRAIDSSRGTIRIPERAIREIRNGDIENESIKQTFFGNVLKVLEDNTASSNSRFVVDFDGTLQEYNYNFVVAYILGVFNTNLDRDECEVLKMFYGLGTKKVHLKDMCPYFDGKYNRQEISEIKNKSIDKIERKINKGVILDLLFDKN